MTEIEERKARLRRRIEKAQAKADKAEQAFFDRLAERFKLEAELRALDPPAEMPDRSEFIKALHSYYVPMFNGHVSKKTGRKERDE